MGGGMGLGAVVGLVMRWHDTERARGLPPFVLVAVAVVSRLVAVADR